MDTTEFFAWRMLVLNSLMQILERRLRRKIHLEIVSITRKSSKGRDRTFSHPRYPKVFYKRGCPFQKMDVAVNAKVSFEDRSGRELAWYDSGTVSLNISLRRDLKRKLSAQLGHDGSHFPEYWYVEDDDWDNWRPITAMMYYAEGQMSHEVVNNPDKYSIKWPNTTHELFHPFKVVLVEKKIVFDHRTAPRGYTHPFS